MSRRDDVNNLIAEHNRYLQKLKEKKASFGLHTPVHILTEIEDVEAEIERLQTELANLEDSGDKISPSRDLFSSKSILLGIIIIAACGIIFTLIFQGTRLFVVPEKSLATSPSVAVLVTPLPTVSPFDTPALTFTPTVTLIFTPIPIVTTTTSLSQSVLITLTPFVDSAIRPAQDEEILVIIAPFDGKEDIRPEVRIETSLLKELESLTDVGMVRVERYPEIIQEKDSKHQLEYLKAEYNPTIIIWGWYDQLGITANYEVTNKGLYFENYEPTFSEVLRLTSAPDEFVFYVTRGLPQETNHLTFFTIAQIYFTNRNYEKAQIFLERAITELSEEQDVAKNALLLSLAWTRVVGFDDFEYAIEVTSNLIENDRRDIGAYMLRGKSYEHMALYRYIKENNITVRNSIELIDGRYVLVTSSDKEIPFEAYRSAEALADYSRIAEINPELPEIYYLRGQQNYAHGNISAAISDMQRFVTEMGDEGQLSNRAQQYINKWSSELQ